jgi:signal transduction histidine kinase
VTFECEFPEEQYVSAAPKLSVAIDNIVQNAVEHNDADAPRVEITIRPATAETEYVELTVADNGPGIPEQEREVLLKGKETDLRHGSGLGLWIVKWVVTRSGGRIDFDKNDSRGSRVTLVLPVAE